MVGEEDWSLPGDVVELRSSGGGGRKRSLNTAIPSLTNTFAGATRDDTNTSSWESAERLVIDESDGVSRVVTFEGDKSTMLEVCKR